MAENDMFALDGLVAVVIGGGGVLAGEMASGLARAGADIAIVDVSEAGAEARAESIRKTTGRRAIGVKADATKKAELQSACDRVVAELGSVDILLNAAGVNSGTPFFEISEEEWHRILDIDLKSVFLACQVFGKVMVDAGRGGSVINISSASSSPPLSKVFTYGVSKGGVNQITQFLAREWAPHKVRVNAILPGFFPAEQNRKLLTEERTNQILNHTPMARFGEASELVGAAVYLASPKAASFVTGSILRVDGGFLAMTI
jgi:NAD(P)-dependent dehydrogenase (short-subunit alcohol dehydrogenase family)